MAAASVEEVLQVHNTLILSRLQVLKLTNWKLKLTNGFSFQYCEEYFPGEPPEYFFDRWVMSFVSSSQALFFFRNPENFPAILDMYRR